MTIRTAAYGFAQKKGMSMAYRVLITIISCAVWFTVGHVMQLPTREDVGYICPPPKMQLHHAAWRAENARNCTGMKKV